MQTHLSIKRIFILIGLVLGLHACQKEKLDTLPVQPTEIAISQDISQAVAYAQQILGPQDTAKYNWRKARVLAEGSTLMGWQIPVKQATAGEWQWLAVGVKDGKPNGLQLNRIQFKGRHAQRVDEIITTDLLSGKRKQYKQEELVGEPQSTSGLRDVKKKSLDGGGTLPMVTVIGQYVNGSTSGVVSGSAVYILAGMLGMDGSSGGTSGEGSSGSAFDNYTNLDYLNPDYSGVSGGGSSYSNRLHLDTARIVDSILFTISAFPGVYDSYPFAWWEKQDWIENNLLVGYNTDRGKWLLFHYDRTKEFRRFTNTSYSNLDLFDKRDIAEPHLDMLMVNTSYYEMVDGFEEASLVAHPWMTELLQELLAEIGGRLLKKFVGIDQWDAVKDALQDAARGDYLSAFGEVINIAKRYIPWLKALDAAVDGVMLSNQAEKVWKAFDKVRRIAPEAFQGLIKTTKARCGKLLDVIEHSPDTDQGVIKYSPNEALSFFKEFAEKSGRIASETSLGSGVWEFELGTVKFTYYPVSGNQSGNKPTLKLSSTNSTWTYKFRFE